MARSPQNTLIRWLLPLGAAIAYAVLVLWYAPQLSAESGGAMPFDLRPFGYDLPAAEAFLAALTEAGRAIYLGPIRVTDTVFVVLMTLTLVQPFRHIAGWRGWAMALPALVYGVADLAENAAVATILRAGAAEAVDVQLASLLTQVKFAAFVLAAVLALAALWRAWRG